MVLEGYFEIFVLCMVLMMIFLYETNHKFRYYFKFGLYGVSVMSSAFVLIAPMLFRPRNVKNLLWVSACGRCISVLLGLKWELRGKEHLEKDQSYVIVINHQSALDVLGTSAMWPAMNKCTAVSKRELLFVWPYGLAGWLGGLIFINRKSPTVAHKELNEAIAHIKIKKIKVCIFAEGTRRNTGQIHTFKKGAFHAAIHAQVPILPVVFSTYRTFLDASKKQFNNGHIIIKTLPPIETTGLTKTDVDDLIQRTHDVMSKEYQLLMKEVTA